jgi:hypothetical protein
MKKIRKQIHYFGAWARRLEGVLIRVEGDGWKEAPEEYKAYVVRLLQSDRLGWAVSFRVATFNKSAHVKVASWGPRSPVGGLGRSWVFQGVLG